MLQRGGEAAAAEPVPAAKQGSGAMTRRAVESRGGGARRARCDGTRSRPRAGADGKPVTVADLLAGSPAADWRVPDPEDTLYMDLARGRVVIELASRVAPQHVANIRALARAHYFDGLAIVRVQDNYVVQWDDPDHHRPVPAGVRAAVEFTAAAGAACALRAPAGSRRLCTASRISRWISRRRAIRARTSVWLAHCYGMVGAGRDDPPESDGTEMYAVIGHAPRQLDRNVALVGRVLKGMELLSSLPRGSGEMGFYVAIGAPGSHPLGAHRRRRAEGGAHADRGAAHR